MKTLRKITLTAIAALLLMAPAAFAGNGGSCSANGGGSYCGGKAASGCWCDSECSNYGDCCGDIENVCDPGEQPEPVAEAYELECYVEEFVLADVDPGQTGGFSVRCDEDYTAMGEGTHVRNSQGGADSFDVDLQDFPSQSNNRDWAVRYRNGNVRGTVDLHGFARCCR
ncbi:MAG: hypothetical protein P8R42_27295 [Candidatus Binatia bacterium]|nr:hypothetical protein [Candidatus Binatia bacterium]